MGETCDCVVPYISTYFYSFVWICTEAKLYQAMLLSIQKLEFN